jgi:hypothetical protein
LVNPFTRADEQDLRRGSRFYLFGFLQRLVKFHDNLKQQEAEGARAMRQRGREEDRVRVRDERREERQESLTVFILT